MNVECPNCGAKGQIDETKRPPGVNAVRCPRCSQSIPLDPVETSVVLPPELPLESALPEPIEPSSPPPEPAPAISPVTPAPAPPQAICTMCGEKFPRTEMIRFGTSWVCAACKPDYVQMLEMGATRPGDMRYAGFWIRFGAKFVDGLILMVVSMLITFLLGLVMSKSPDPSTAFAVAAVQFVLQIGVAVAYNVYFLCNHRATPGKMACGLVVVTPDGEKLSYGRAAGRYFAEMLSSFILGIGYLMVAFDEEKRALHDRICMTRVIYR